MREMKDSGIEWIGKIPVNWKTERLQWHLQEVNIGNNPVQTTNILSLTNKKGVIPYEEKGNQGNKSKEDVSGYKLAYPNTIVANSMNVIIGSVGLSKYYGCVSPVYYVFKAVNNDSIDFYNYIFSVVGFQRELRKFANGILEIRLRVSSDSILKRPVAIPPIDEQKRIVAFLDSKCSELDALSADIQKEIEILEQYKRSVITEAVTKGLNPDAEMKDSKNQRIGTIPAHWNVHKIKYHIASISSGLSAVTSDSSSSESGKYVLRTSAVSTGVFKPNEVKAVLENVIDRLVCPVEVDTLVMSRMNTAEMVGYCAYIGNPYPNYYLPDKLWKIHTQPSLYAKYAWFVINSSVSHRWFASIATGASSSMLNISLLDFEQLVIPVPPRNEQNCIADFLEKKCSEVEIAIQEKKQQLEVLDSYKKSLIYEYVTGKKEVPNEQ